MNGAVCRAKNGAEHEILALLKNCVQKKIVDAVCIPVKVPAGDSYTYLLIKNPSLIDRASPLPPVMPVQGARALMRLTRLGKGQGKIAAVMRPCEIRAAVELCKLEQVDLENIILLSIDCPGTLPLLDYVRDPEQGESRYAEIRGNWLSDSVRPVCRICDSGAILASDLHIGLVGAKKDQFFLIPKSEAGQDLLASLGIEAGGGSVQPWESASEDLIAKRREVRKAAQATLRTTLQGAENVMSALQQCINCHNCQRVCPICYCRQCYFDSEALKLSSENYLARARGKGALRLPPDTLLFHLGRMSHMALSCVSCGACEDACPMLLPIAQIFNLVAEDAQKEFAYVPGLDREEPLPLVTYKKEEFTKVEDAYLKTYSIEEE